MNEEASIGNVIDLIKDTMRNTRYGFEILVIDTNSKDRTREIAREKGARVIEEPRRGYGRAYKTGFERASGEIIATLDADCTYPAEDIPRLSDQLFAEELDFITTNRMAQMEEGAMSTMHRFGNWVLNVTAKVLFSVSFKDSQSGMWVFRKSILPKINLESDGMAMSEELKAEAFKKVRSAEVPISYRPRVGEVKLSSWKDGLGNLRFLFRKRFRAT